MRRGKLPFSIGIVGIALVSLGFGPVNVVEPTVVPMEAQAVPSAPAEGSQPEPQRPQTPEEVKAAETRLVFNRLLVDAAVLRTNLDNFRRGKSKTPVSLSAFRSLEIRLKEIADADPANTQARDMSNAMKMAQFEILQPSVEIAAGANRELYAYAMADQLKDQGVRVEVSGRGNRVVRFSSPQMVREMAIKLADSGRIFEQARSLEFSRVVFTDGRRYFTYDVARGRFR